MMTVKELFEQFGVECPLWLDDILEDDWTTSKHQVDKEIHSWILTTPMFTKVVTFDGEMYDYKVYDINDIELSVPLTTKSIGIDGTCVTTC